MTQESPRFSTTSSSTREVGSIRIVHHICVMQNDKVIAGSSSKYPYLLAASGTSEHCDNIANACAHHHETALRGSDEHQSGLHGGSLSFADYMPLGSTHSIIEILGEAQNLILHWASWELASESRCPVPKVNDCRSLCPRIDLNLLEASI